MKPTIMIIEDDPDIRDLLADALSTNGFQPAPYASGKDALSAFDEKTHDLILLDIQLPDSSGFDICEAIRNKSMVPIIFVSCMVDGSDIIRGLEIGGDDYVTKPFDLHQLIARIRSNLRRTPLFQEIGKDALVNQVDEASVGPLTLNFPLQRVTVNGKTVPLTTKEFRILSILALNPDKVFSAHQLYTLVWGEDSLGETQALKVHISRLRAKLQTAANDQIGVNMIRGFGYQFMNGEQQKST